MGSEAEVNATVIEADIVSVIDEKVLGRISDKPVKGNDFGPVFWRADEANGVDIFAVFLRAPVEVIEAVVVGRVNDCEFAFAEINFSIGVAIL